MSEQTVLELLKELGGAASSSKISRFMRNKYPDLSLWQYVGDRLRKLKKLGLVDYAANKNKHFIVVVGLGEREEQSEAVDLLNQVIKLRSDE